jgi:hypothetical protein
MKQFLIILIAIVLLVSCKKNYYTFNNRAEQYNAAASQDYEKINEDDISKSGSAIGRSLKETSDNKPQKISINCGFSENKVTKVNPGDFKNLQLIKKEGTQEKNLIVKKAPVLWELFFFYIGMAAMVIMCACFPLMLYFKIVGEIMILKTIVTISWISILVALVSFYFAIYFWQKT